MAYSDKFIDCCLTIISHGHYNLKVKKYLKYKYHVLFRIMGQTFADKVYASDNHNEFPLVGGKMGRLEKVNGRGVLRDFYIDLHDWLVHHDFKDNWDTKGQAKAGEWANAPHNSNRTGDMWETEFTMMDNGDSKEIEIRWEATLHLHDSIHGHLYFKLDVVCRRMIEVETLVDGKKKIEQEGAWEFRNKIFYRNHAFKNHIMKIPIINKSEKLQEYFFGFFHENQIDIDIKHCSEHYVAGIRKMIYKHFG